MVTGTMRLPGGRPRPGRQTASRCIAVSLARALAPTLTRPLQLSAVRLDASPGPAWRGPDTSDRDWHRTSAAAHS